VKKPKPRVLPKRDRPPKRGTVRQINISMSTDEQLERMRRAVQRVLPKRDRPPKRGTVRQINISMSTDELLELERMRRAVQMERSTFIRRAIACFSAHIWPEGAP